MLVQDTKILKIFTCPAYFLVKIGKNTLKISNFQRILHQKSFVIALGWVEFSYPLVPCHYDGAEIFTLLLFTSHAYFKVPNIKSNKSPNVKYVSDEI